MKKPVKLSIGVDFACADAAFAAKVLSEELEKRVGREVPLVGYGEGGVDMAVSASEAPERGYRFDSANGAVKIFGHDRLALIHGAGRLLREADWSGAQLSIEDISMATAPKKAHRGSQIGYRAKTNAYDAWDKATYAQYLREQALFGASAAEFLPPKTDDARSNELMKYSAIDMTAFTVTVAKELGMEVWLWYPNGFKNETGLPLPAAGFLPETSEGARALNAILREEDEMRRSDFAALARVDHVLIPGGDPGHLNPGDLFAMGERVARLLNEAHPGGKVWITPQVMHHGQEFTEEFYALLSKNPAWLHGVSHAPWCNHTLEKCRERTPAYMPIRNYPDICHLLCCQYPVHNWDPVWAVTAGRECYNPRPRWHKQAHNASAPFHDGCVHYSEGIADDVAKMIWLDQDWDDATPYMKTLTDFANMFISPAHKGELASVIAAFEDVFEGPAVLNGTVPQLWRRMKTLKLRLEREPYEKGFGADSYRFKMPLLMSAFYAYVQERAIRDKELWRGAWARLDQGGSCKSVVADMKEIIKQVDTSPNEALKKTVWALGDELFEQIGWQVSATRHHAASYSRGGFLDQMDVPLCDAYWLEDKLNGMPETGAKAKLEKLRGLRDPGPGGKYISFGEPDAARYIELDHSWWSEPEATTIPRIEHHVSMWTPEMRGKDTLKWTYLERVSSLLAYYDGVVSVSVDGLMPGAAYELRIVYSMRFGFAGEKEIPTHVHVNGERLRCGGFDPADPYVYRYAVKPGMVGSDGVLKIDLVKDPIPRGTGITELWAVPVGK